MQITNDKTDYIPTDKPFLSPKDLSKFIDISVGTLAVWRTNGTYGIPYIKIGGKVMYPVTEVNKWIQSRVHGTITQG